MANAWTRIGSINDLTTAYWVLVILKVIAVALYLVGVQRCASAATRIA